MIRYIIAGITGLVFLHHVLCTILYNAPLNPMTAKYQSYVTKYMEPEFSQKWLLFAPEPATSDLKLWYRLKSGNTWTRWNDPLEPVLKEHTRRRYTYHAKLLYVYGNLARELGIQNEELNFRFNCDSANLTCRKEKDEALLSSPEFGRAKEYIRRDVASAQPATTWDSLQLLIIHIYPKQFSERKSKKPFGFANSVEFTPVPFSGS